MSYGDRKDTPALMRSVTRTADRFDPAYQFATRGDSSAASTAKRPGARQGSTAGIESWERRSTRHDVIIPTAGDDEDERTQTRHPFPALVARWQKDAGGQGLLGPAALASAVPRSERRLRDTGENPAAKRIEWYVRLKLRQDLLGKLWARSLMPRDVLVWSQDDQHWLRLEEIPRLQSYVAEVVRDWEARERALPAPAHWSSAPPPPSVGRVNDGRPDVVFRPTGSAARHLASTIPPPGQASPGSSIPAAPRVPSFDEVMEGTVQASERAEHAPASGGPRSGLAALTQSSVVPPRVSRAAVVTSSHSERHAGAGASVAPTLPAPRTVTVPPVAQRTASAGRSSGVDYIERLVWMVAGVATMFAVMAALGKIRRSDFWQESASVAGLAPALGSMLSARVAEVSDSLRPSTSLPPASAKPVSAPPEASASEAASASDTSESESTESRRSWASAGRRFGKAPGRHAPEQPDEKPAVDKSVAEAGESPDTGKAAADAEPTARGLGSFDRTAARRALAGAAARASKCADGAARGTVVVTYASSGLVQNVSVAELSGDGVSAGCVIRTFQSARVTPYFGGSVTVRKTFSVK